MIRKTFYLLALLALLSTPALAQQAQLSLRTSVTDADGQITLGDLFDNAGDAAGVVVGTRQGTTAILDAAQVQAIAARNGAYWDNPNGLRRIIVSGGADGAPAANATAMTGTASPAFQAGPAVSAAPRNIQVLVFTHAMNTGDVVQPEDLQYAQVASTGGAVPSDPSAVVGKTARYPLREGGVAHLSDLTSPTVAKRGQTLAVTWSSGSLSLTMDGILQKDAAVGDLVQVQNPASLKLIDVVVTGPGQGVAGPAADRLRSPVLLSSR